MPYPIEDKLVIAVSSSALFDMQASDAIFKQEGESAYREYQQNHIDDPLGKENHLNRLFLCERLV